MDMDLFFLSEVPPVLLLLVVAAVDGGCCDAACPPAPACPDTATAFFTSRRVIYRILVLLIPLQNLQY